MQTGLLPLVWAVTLVLRAARRAALQALEATTATAHSTLQAVLIARGNWYKMQACSLAATLQAGVHRARPGLMSPALVATGNKLGVRRVAVTAAARHQAQAAPPLVHHLVHHPVLAARPRRALAALLQALAVHHLALPQAPVVTAAAAVTRTGIQTAIIHLELSSAIAQLALLWSMNTKLNGGPTITTLRQTLAHGRSGNKSVAANNSYC